MKIYVTKYALTKRGILSFDSDNELNQITPSKDALGIVVGWYVDRLGYWMSEEFMNEHVHTELDAAVECANKMRIKNIESLRSKIAKLEQLRWSEPE